MLRKTLNLTAIISLIMLGTVSSLGCGQEPDRRAIEPTQEEQNAG